MKRKILTILILSVTLSLSAQHYIETSISMEDKAIGINYMNLDIGLAVGAENGLYQHSSYKVEHQRYKLGFARMFLAPYHGQSDIIVSLSACYNKYNVLYKDEHLAKLKKFSIDFGVRPNLTKHMFIGFNYDIVLQHGGFSVGFLID